MLKVQQGFTLIEFIFVIMLLGIIAAISSQMLTQGVMAYFTATNVVDANWQGQLAIQRMMRDMSIVRSSNDISTANTNTFSFTDINGNTVSYALSGSSLSLTYNSNALILADGLQSLTFQYYDKNGAITATNNLIRYVKMTLNFSYKNTIYAVISAVYLRNCS